MDVSTDLIYDAKRKLLAKYPRFGSEIAVSNIEYSDNLKYHTVATDGKNIYVNPKYFESLSENDRLFIIAHEIMHIIFMHMYRLKDKEGVRRDPELWRIATDAIIDANLERDGFIIKEGYVNMPEALNYSAEEFYQKLLQEKEKQEQEKQKNEQESQEQNDSEEQEQEKQKNDQESQEENDSEEQEQDDNGQGNGQNNDQDKKEKQDETQEQDNEQEKVEGNTEKDEKAQGQVTPQGDDHSLWEEAFEEYQKKDAKEQQKGQKENFKREQQQEEQQEQTQDEQEESFDEKQEFEDNRKEKRKKFKSRSEKIKKNIIETSKETIKLDNIGESKETIDWKVLLRREVEKTETVWSQRRSIAENNYAYRLEENDIGDEAETEVMIDVSGSVGLGLVKAFLRQLKPLIKQSKLRVGCFNENFWGFVEIKNVQDIDNFTIPQGARGDSAWTEDWDLAVRSFTKKREINKIVFTDGYPCPGTMPKEDLKRENVVWLVYGNEDFKPCCGKVINITRRQLEQLYQLDRSILHMR